MGGVSGPVHMSDVGSWNLKLQLGNQTFLQKKIVLCLQASQKIDMQAEDEKEIGEQNENISVQLSLMIINI